MTGNPTLDTVVFIAIGIGVAIGAIVVTLFGFIVYVKPRIEKLLAPTVRAAEDAAKTQAVTTSKITAEQWFADFGKRKFDEVDLRNQEADHRYEDLQQRFERLEADAALRAADDQRRINELGAQVKTLTEQVRVLETERSAITRERDLALQKAEELGREVDRLRKESEKSADKISKHEIELAGLKAGNAVLQGIFDKIQWLGATNGAAPGAPPASAPLVTTETG